LSTLQFFPSDISQLSIIHSKNVTDKGIAFLRQHQKLEDANFAFCRGISYEAVKTFVGDHPELKRVNITACSFATKENVNALKAAFPNLDIDCSFYVAG